ncbi:MAG: hypothetical protein OXG64_00800 [Chloroflexi bacterium]|nr:hypothetical protein [Chloroflexota bacterium]
MAITSVVEHRANLGDEIGALQHPSTPPSGVADNMMRTECMHVASTRIAELLKDSGFIIAWTLDGDVRATAIDHWSKSTRMASNAPVQHALRITGTGSLSYDVLGAVRAVEHVNQDLIVSASADALRSAGHPAVANQLLQVHRDAEADGDGLWFNQTALTNAIIVITAAVLATRFPSVVIGPGSDGAAHVRYDNDATGAMVNLIFQPDGLVWFFVSHEEFFDSGSVQFEDCHARIESIAQST